MPLKMSYQQALLAELQDLPEETLPQLIKIIHLIKESVLTQSRQTMMALYQEMTEWDQLSGEGCQILKRGYNMKLGDLYLVEIPSSNGREQAGSRPG